jgi:hypothetical protein
MSIDRAKFSASSLVDGDELNRISADYNKQIAKIGATTDISALKEQLKFIQTNMTFYQQAMLTETDAKNRDVMASYFNAYKDIRKVANEQMAGLVKDLAAKNAAIAANAGKRKIEKQMTYVAPRLGISQIPIAPALTIEDSVKMMQDEVKRQAAREKELKQIAAMNALLEQQNTILGLTNLLAGALTTGFEQMFTTLIDGGQNAFQGILNAIKSLMIKLASAIAAAAILFVLTGGLSAGGSSLGSIGQIAKTIGGLGFNPFALGSGSGKGSMIAMPSNSIGQGGYQIDIMGDKMRMLLDNTAIKNSRVI